MQEKGELGDRNKNPTTETSTIFCSLPLRLTSLEAVLRGNRAWPASPAPCAPTGRRGHAPPRAGGRPLRLDAADVRHFKELFLASRLGGGGREPGEAVLLKRQPARFRFPRAARRLALLSAGARARRGAGPRPAGPAVPHGAPPRALQALPSREGAGESGRTHCFSRVRAFSAGAPRSPADGTEARPPPRRKTGAASATANSPGSLLLAPSPRGRSVPSVAAGRTPGPPTPTLPLRGHPRPGLTRPPRGRTATADRPPATEERPPAGRAPSVRLRGPCSFVLSFNSGGASLRVGTVWQPPRASTDLGGARTRAGRPSDNTGRQEVPPAEIREAAARALRLQAGRVRCSPPRSSREPCSCPRGWPSSPPTLTTSPPGAELAPHSPAVTSTNISAGL